MTSLQEASASVLKFCEARGYSEEDIALIAGCLLNALVTDVGVRHTIVDEFERAYQEDAR